jgi:hypothetical protein
MNRKQIALIPLLIAVIVAAVLSAVVRVRNELALPRREPASAWNRELQRIDMKSFEVFSETLRDWTTKYAPNGAGRYRNPRTGEYTVVEPMKCASCGQLIPVPATMPPPAWPFLGPGKRIDGEAAIAALKALADFKLNYKCPKCGKRAFPIVPSPSPSPASTATRTPTPSLPQSK